MENILNKYNQAINLFEFDTNDLPFTKNADLFKKHGDDFVFTIKSMFTHSKGNYGEQAHIATPDFITGAPTELTENIKAMCSDDEIIDLAQSDKLGFKVRQYTKTDGKVCHSIIFVLID